MARAAQTGSKDDEDQNGDTVAESINGVTRKVGLLMAERGKIEGPADPPGLPVSSGDKRREDQPLEAEMELPREQVVAEQEIKDAGLNEKDDETEASKKAMAPGRPAKKGAAAEKEDEPMDTEEAAEEEKPTESKKKNPPGKKPAAAAKKSEASDDDMSSESLKKNDGKKGGKKNDKPAPQSSTRPGRIAKTAAREIIVAESQEKQLTAFEDDGEEAAPKKTRGRKPPISIRNPEEDEEVPKKTRGRKPPFYIRDHEEEEAVPKKTRGRKPPISIRDPVDDEEAPPALKKGRPSISFRQREAAFNVTHMPIPSSTQIQSSTANQPSKLYESLNDKEYHDVIFTASDGTKLSTYRCVLAKYSPVFRDIFKKNTVLPFRISLNDYSPTTIQAALDFMFEKRDSIVGKEAEVFKFAAKYDIRDLLVVCSKYAVASITPSNIFDYIEIAYSNNFEELKQKCLKLLVEKKKEVDPSKFAKLPEKILIDFYRF